VASEHFSSLEAEAMVRSLLGASKPQKRKPWDAEIGPWRIEIKLGTGKTRVSWSGLLRKGEPWHYLVLVWRSPIPLSRKTDPLDARFIFSVLRRQTVDMLVGHQQGNGQFNIAVYILRGGIPRYGNRPPGREVPDIVAGKRTAEQLKAFGAELNAKLRPGGV